MAHRLLGLAIRAIFLQYFPDPQSFKKGRDIQKAKAKPNPYQPVIDWFGKNNDVVLMQDDTDADFLAGLYKVDGLYAAVKQFYPDADEARTGLFMEFLLHGLAEFSLISKKGIEKGGYAFRDMLRSMLNLNISEDEED